MTDGKLADFLRTMRILSTVSPNIARNTVRPQEPASDTRKGYTDEQYGLTGLDFTITTGVIVDTIPFNYLYRVQIAKCSMPVTCSTLQTLVSGSVQVSDCHSYTVGTNVLVAYSIARGRGIIIGGYELPQDLAEYNVKRNISSVCRIPQEVSFKGILIENKFGVADGTFNAANYKFEEHTDTPEFGFSFVTGMKLFVDPYMAILAANDYTGINIFDKDSLLRLSGINMQTRTSGKEVEYLNDEGEYIEYDGTALYPWEQFGRYVKPDGKIVKEIDEKEWHTEDSIINYYMPVEEKLRPFHRHINFGGWLGQGQLHQICAPAFGKIWAKFEEEHKTPCLNRIHEDVSGMLSFMSAKGVSITKSGMTPAAVRTHRPDEIHKEKGDNRNNYNNENLLLPAEIKTNAENPRMQEVMGIMDYSGYNKNWKDIFQLAYHAGDYYLPEESAMPHKSIQAPPYEQLKGSYMINDDSIKYKLDIDDKRKNREFMANEAGIHILPSGGIVIYDGVGSEIRFINGQLTISCAGDINIKPGRNLHLWSGGNTIIRSGGNIEESSTSGTVRIKAEKNLELLGANNGSANSGVLIESKSKGNGYNYDKMGDEIVTNGVTIKSAYSPVTLNGNLVYLRSGSKEAAGTGVVIDADHGKTKIRMTATDIDEYISLSHTINYVNAGTGDTKATTFFTQNLNGIVGECVITDRLTLSKDLIQAGSQYVCGTIHSYGNQSGYITVLSTGEKDLYNQSVILTERVPKEEKPKEYKEIYNNELEKPIYATYHIGNDDLLKKVSFSFRTDQQLSLPKDYYVYEDLWQHIASHSGAEIDTWGENPVKSATGETYPFPGKKWFTEKKYVRQDPVIADFYKKLYIDRKVKKGDTKPGEKKYAEPEYGKQHKISLNDYPVI